MESKAQCRRIMYL